MKQLEFNFEAVPEVVKEISKVVESKWPRLSIKEMRECSSIENEYFAGSRIYRICCEEAKHQLKEIEAGRAFASQRYKKMLKSY